MQCEKCLKTVVEQDDLTRFELLVTFLNTFWEGDAYPEHIWSKNLCKDCVGSIINEIRNILGGSNAFRKWEKGGNPVIVRIDQEDKS